MSLNIIANLTAPDVMYKSNLEPDEVALLKCYMLVLMSKGHLTDSLMKYAPNQLLSLDYASDGEHLEFFNSTYESYIKDIIKKSRSQYLNGLISSFKNIDQGELKRALPQTFDSLIRNYFSYRGKYGQGEMQPKELTELMTYFLPKNQKYKVYNPFAGMASFALSLPEGVDYYGQEIFEETWILAKLRMIAHACPREYRLKNIDSIASWSVNRGEVYDHVIFNPPFNLKLNSDQLNLFGNSPYAVKGNTNSLIIAETFNRLKKNGRSIFIVPDSFLFNKTRVERRLKKELVRNKNIHAIISLPKGIWNTASISTSLIVLTKEKNDKAKFIDASDLFIKDGKDVRLDVSLIIQAYEESNNPKSSSVPFERLELTYDNLSVNFYQFEELELSREQEKNLVKFNKIARKVPVKRPEFKTGKFIRIRDLADDSLNSAKGFNDLREIEISRKNAGILEDEALLVAITWKSLKPTNFIKTDEAISYDTSSIMAFDLDKESVLPEYLVLELNKDYVKNQLDRFRIGTVVPRLNRTALNQIKVVVPSLEVQQEIIQDHKIQHISAEQAKLKDMMDAYGIDVADDNSFLRHRIAGRLNNVHGAYNRVKKIISDQVVPKFPDAYSLKFNPKLEKTLLDYLNIIERDLNTIQEAVSDVGQKLKIEDATFENFDIVKFLHNYKSETESNENKGYDLILVEDETLLDLGNIKEVNMKGDRRLLRTLLDNIVENAVHHAFDNSSINRIEIKVDYDFSNFNVVLNISNTGKPWPDGFELHQFIRKGSRKSRTHGNGMGGSIINDIVNKHDGKIELKKNKTDESNPFVTTLVLTFPMAITL